MKKNLLFLFIVVMVIVACQQTPKIVPVDIKAEEATLNKLMDSIDFKSNLTEDALICGTDPSEFWNKQQFLEQLEQAKNAAPEFQSIGDRKIKVAPDGNSAIPWRQVYHFVKTNDKWMIQFVNIAFIPKNEDIQKINEAIK
jgi:hypothetical protein